MAVRLSALRAGRCFTPQKHYFYACSNFSVRVNPRASKDYVNSLKLFASLGLEPATFQLVAQQINHYASEDRITSVIRVKRIIELGTKLTVAIYC
jgi:hypothetical protein